MTLVPIVPVVRGSLRASFGARPTVLVGIVFCLVVLAGPASALTATDHVVQPGETLAGIAEKYGFPIETLMDVNGIVNPHTIQAGQTLRIPGSTTDVPAPTATPDSSPSAAPSNRIHLVAPGDTLTRIAARYEVTLAELRELNRLTNDLIFIGELLQIPAPPAPPPPPTLNYTVKAGDTLNEIAKQFGVPLPVIVEANGIKSVDAIFPGQVISIPGAAAPAGPAAPQPAVHVVAAGETLSSIARRYGVSVQRLGDANNHADNDVIHEGLRLVIPGPATPSQTTGYSARNHTVEPGETLSHIAERYTVSVTTLMSENAIANPNFVFVGQVLRIPGPGGGSPPAAAAAPPPSRSYVVQAGDTLGIIAGKHGVSLAAMIDANGLTNPNSIIEGQTLTIPGGSGAAPDRGPSRAEYERILEQAAAEFGVRSALIKAIAWQESGWNQWVISSAQAAGLMQVTPYTAEWALLTLVPDATAWRTSPVDNARMGTAILRHWLDQGGGDEVSAIAAYYQGWRSLKEIGMYEETKVYVANVQALIPEFE